MSKYTFQIGQGLFAGTSFAVMTVTSAMSFASIPPRVMRAFFTVETAPCRYRYDGTAPTASTGHLLGSGDSVQILGLSNINNFSVVAVSNAATLMVTYEVDSR